MKVAFYITVGFVLIIVLTFILTSDGAFTQVIALFEWATKFILPWIALYWFIKFVKSKHE